MDRSLGDIGLARVFLAALIAGESDASAGTKLVETAIFVVAPAFVFVAVAALVAVVGLAILLWKLVTTRPRRAA